MKMKRIIILSAIAVITAGCFQGKGSETGPQETLETFYRSLCSGNFDEVEKLCMKPEMDEYLDNFRKVWEKTDSTTAAIASDMLSEMSIEVIDQEKDGQIRTIFYELTATDGQNKEKVATLRKEEGAWKIEAITDRH